MKKMSKIGGTVLLMVFSLSLVACSGMKHKEGMMKEDGGMMEKEKMMKEEGAMMDHDEKMGK